jgi:hypothetical protein
MAAGTPLRLCRHKRRAHSAHRREPHLPPAPSPCALQDVCKAMAEKIGFEDPEEDCLCFSLNECLDGVTSA